MQREGQRDCLSCHYLGPCPPQSLPEMVVVLIAVVVVVIAVVVAVVVIVVVVVVVIGASTSQTLYIHLFPPSIHFLPPQFLFESPAHVYLVHSESATLLALGGKVVPLRQTSLQTPKYVLLCDELQSLHLSNKDIVQCMSTFACLFLYTPNYNGFNTRNRRKVSNSLTEPIMCLGVASISGVNPESVHT